MSEFEFLFTGITIVLALAVARLLEGLRDTFDETRRFWIHSLWVVNRLMLALSFFWAQFDDRARTAISFFVFLGLVTPPAILFLQANALVTAQSGTVPSWSGQFWTIRRWFFGSNMILVLSSFLAYSYNEGGDALPYAALGAGLLLSIVGFVTANERVHGALAVIGVLIVGANLARIAMDA